MPRTYEPTWSSLRDHTTPAWLREKKFGIYTHWGVYSVPACGPNGTWYAHNMYRPGNSQYEYHEKTYGPATEFGYKDFIPMFTAKKFDAAEWAELFKASGAAFAGPVAEHHDGFSMWDSKVNEWNAARMGPKRDIVGELEKAVRAEGMRFMIALHHAEQWWFYPHWRSDCDVSNPEFAGLYGPMHNLDGLDKGGIPPERMREWYWQDRPTEAFLNFWRGKAHELIDSYRPDLIWFDFGINFVLEEYRKELLAHYYNKEREWDRELAVTYKGHDLGTGSAIIDYELGRMDRLTYYDWITDTSVDDQGAWSYVPDAAFKKVSTLVHNLIDNVSKNGYLLLNVGPKLDGTIPEGAKQCLIGIGKWLQINGEAIFATEPWLSYGEGPTKMETSGMFSEQKEVEYTPADFRFTCRDNLLYATCLGWPESRVTIRSMKKLYPGEIESVKMLGVDAELDWSVTEDGLEVEPPSTKPCEEAFVFKITRKNPF
jgi:alpha-L-fucosidase|tara:strand:- start:2716 stop:4167 length:1452 start_codon:yes stop_codon:yes gene_type:complete